MTSSSHRYLTLNTIHKLESELIAHCYLDNIILHTSITIVCLSDTEVVASINNEI